MMAQEVALITFFGAVIVIGITALFTVTTRLRL